MRDDHARTKQRVEEFGLKQMWKSPERHDPQHPGRRDLPPADHLPNVPRLVPGWTKPIVVGRHAFGDQYRATDFRFPGAGKLTMKFVGDDGTVIETRRLCRPVLGRLHGHVQP